MSGAELAVVEPQQGIDVGRWADTLVFAAQLAEKVHDTEFVPKALRGRPEAVAATIMYGAEVGVTPMQALAGIHIVDGRPSPSAELMRAMILRAGHSFTVHESTGTRCRVSGLRRGRPESERFTVDWSLDMARAAGLLSKQNWRNYPRAMLTARAFGDLARVLFPDVVKGLGYVAEDVSVDDLQRWDVDGPDTAPEPPRKRLQRKQRRAVQSAAGEPSEPQNGPAELPPVAPPLAPNPPAAAAPPTDNDLARDDVTQANDADELRAPDEPEDTGPPSADELAERRAEIAERHRYDPADVPLPDEQQPTGTGRPLPTPQPEQTPDEPPAPEAGPRTIGEQSSMFRAMQAGLTKQLGTVATREERHELVGAILGKPIESTKDLTPEQARRVLDMLGRFDDGSASWQLDIGTGEITVTDNREPPNVGEP